MSKPNLIGFSTALGFYGNKRVCDAQDLAGKSIRTKVDFSIIVPMLFQMVMAYAGANQTDGNFEGYTPKDWRRVFLLNNLELPPDQVQTVIKIFHQVGLFDHGRIRSWNKFNRHLGEYEKIVRAKRLASKMAAKKRAFDAKNELELPLKSAQNDEKNRSESAKKPLKKREKSAQKSAQKNGAADGVSRQVWLLKQQLEMSTSTQEGDAIRARIRELTRSANNLTPAKPVKTSARPARQAQKASAPTEAELLEGAQYLVQIGKHDLLTAAQRRLLRREQAQSPAL